jgi:hypothetical protein
MTQPRRRNCLPVEMDAWTEHDLEIVSSWRLECEQRPRSVPGARLGGS